MVLTTSGASLELNRLIKDVPGKHRDMCQKLGDKLLDNDSVTFARNTLAGYSGAMPSVRKRFRRYELDSAIRVGREAGFLPTAWNPYWLLIRWVVIPFLKKLLFGGDKET
jgi:hypothetical protein